MEPRSQQKQPKIAFELEMPDDLKRFRLPTAVNNRLQELLDRQDNGEALSPAERAAAEGLVNLAEFLSLLRLRAERADRKVKGDRAGTGRKRKSGF